MSDKQDPKKKDGERTDKKHERMHEDVHARKEQADLTAAGDPIKATPMIKTAVAQSHNH